VDSLNLASLARIFSRLERDYPTDDAENLSDRIDKARQYVDSHLYRADVVPALPPDAPAGYLMVKAGDINLYIGTGTGSPLRRIPTQAVP
jgi:hypothetical protein